MHVIYVIYVCVALQCSTWAFNDGGAENRQKPILVGVPKNISFVQSEVCQQLPFTGGPLLTLFFETLEKQLCKQKTV